MKDPKKQKAKTYNRRKKEYEKMRAGNTRLHKQICSVNLQIEDHKKTLSLRKVDLGFKLVGGTLMGCVGGMFPVALFCPEADTLSELINGFIKKVGEEPLVATTPIIGFITGFSLLNYILYKNDSLSFSDIKKAFKYNNSLLDKKSILQAKLDKKNYVDADKFYNKESTKKYKK